MVRTLQAILNNVNTHFSKGEWKEDVSVYLRIMMKGSNTNKKEFAFMLTGGGKNSAPLWTAPPAPPSLILEIGLLTTSLQQAVKIKT